jgi:hypothetical protein
MKWKTKKYKSGDTRIIKKFLWSPLTINEETKFLEYVEYEQQLTNLLPKLINNLRWVNTRWVN